MSTHVDETFGMKQVATVHFYEVQTISNGCP